MTQKKSTPSEGEKTQLLVSLDEATRRVNSQIEKGSSLLNIRIGSEEELGRARAEHDAWQDFTKELLKQIFSTSELADEFRSPISGFAIGGRIPTLQERIGNFQREIRRDRDKLTSIRGRLELFTITVAEHSQDAINSIAVLERIARRFHIASRQLRQRHGGRATLEISDEYDVQDFLHALLKIFFDDVRSEEWTPSYAGGASRMDFLLKTEQIVVEVKKTRTGLNAREIGNQLLVDIGRYQLHPDCHYLVCFVYDPDQIIVNPDGLERDLSQAVNEMTVKVVIAPKGH